MQLSENLATITQLARKLNVGQATVWRWIRSGVKSKSGQTVKLEAQFIGGRWISSTESLDRFIAATNEAAADSDAPPPRTPGKRLRAAADAGRRLKEMGA